MRICAVHHFQEVASGNSKVVCVLFCSYVAKEWWGPREDPQTFVGGSVCLQPLVAGRANIWLVGKKLNRLCIYKPTKSLTSKSALVQRATHQMKTRYEPLRAPGLTKMVVHPRKGQQMPVLG